MSGNVVQVEVEVEVNGVQKETNGYEKNNEKVKANGAWITKEFLQEVLCDHENNNDIQVLSHDVCAAVGVGDNYLSILYRTTVEYQRKDSGEKESRQLMIKGAPTAKFLVEFIEDLGIFQKELAMYQDCLPVMVDILKEYMPEEKVFIAAHGYKCARPNTIIMEDLSVDGYKMANRRKQLNYEHCLASLRSLARFHALSVKVQERSPSIIDAVSSEFYQETNREKMAPYLEKCFPILAEEMDKWGKYSRFADVVRGLAHCCYDKLIYIVKPTPGSLPVLNHGDFWVNNMLYKYDNQGNLVHAKLVDFQLARLGPPHFQLSKMLLTKTCSRYTSPSMDLLYFLFTSPQAAVLQEHMFELIALYHEALTADLEKLDCDPSLLSLDQLHEELKDRSYFGLIVLATILPIIVAKPADAMDLDNFDPDNINVDDFPLRNNYRDSYFIETAGKFLEQLEKIGYLGCAMDRLRHVEETIASGQVST